MTLTKENLPTSEQLMKTLLNVCQEKRDVHISKLPGAICFSCELEKMIATDDTLAPTMADVTAQAIIALEHNNAQPLRALLAGMLLVGIKLGLEIQNQTPDCDWLKKLYENS